MKTNAMKRRKQKIVTTYGFDSYNQTIENEVAQPIRSVSGSDTFPKAVINICFDRAERDIYGVCPYNQEIYVELSPTIKSSQAVANSGACVMFNVIAFENDPTIKVDTDGIGFSLRSREYKDPQCVVINKTGNSFGFIPRNGSAARDIGFECEVCPTLRSDSQSCQVGLLISCDRRSERNGQ